MFTSRLAGILLLTGGLPAMAAQIGDQVFIDGNRNAAFNTGEPGLPGVTVNLTWAGPDGNFATAGDNQTFTQITGVNGAYNFNVAQAGNFRVDLDNTSLPVGLAVVPGNDPQTFTAVGAAQVITTADFPIVSDGLTLTLWTVNEANPGTNLPRSGSGSPRLFCFTDYTDQSGAHQFIDYGQLVWRDSGGVIQTFAGGDETNAESLAIDTRNGDAYVVINRATGGFTVPVLFKVNLFALRPNAAQVELIRIGEVRDAGGAAASDIEGIAFDEPANLIYAVNTEGTQATDPERLLEINPLTAEWATRGFIQGIVSGTPYALTYTDGLEVVPTINPAGKTIAGTFYSYDQQDNHLYEINPANGAITALINTVTDTNTDIETIAWDEQFDRMISVDNGLYQLATIPLDGSAPVVMSTYTQQGLANSAATNDLEGAGFFLRGAFPLASIGNHIWHDSNGNGQWDTGEQPFNNVTVHLLFDGNDDGDFTDPGEQTPYVTTVTSSQGFYEIAGLPAGRYQLVIPASNFAGGAPLAAFTLSSPVTDTADNRNDTDDNGSQSAPGMAVTGPAIVLSEGEIDRTVDFGFLAADYGDAPLAVQSGFPGTYPVLLADGGAWHADAGPALGAARDAETDGQPSPLSDGDDADEDGVTPTDLIAGQTAGFTVNASAPALLDAWIDWNADGDWDDQDEQIAASLPLLAGNNSLIIGVPGTIAHSYSYARFRLSSAGGLTPGGGADDGEVEDYQVNLLWLGSLSGRVLLDTDNDNDGDTGIENVTVTLVDAVGNPVDGDPGTPGLQIVTNVTDPSGGYAFTDLPPGIYGVVESQPAGYISVGDSDGGSPNEVRPIVVASNVDNPGNDFIEEIPVGLGSFIFADTNANGYLDSGEGGVPGIQVQLRFDANNDGDCADPGESTPVQTVFTSGGNYSFSNLPPGNYQIVIPFPPSGLALSSPGADVNDNQQDHDDNGTQANPGNPTFGPVIALFAGTEPDIAADGTDNNTDSTVDFAFTSPKANNWIAWQNLNPLGGQNGPNQNPDGDINDNLIEFAFCYPPRNGVPRNPIGRRAFCLLQSANGGFDVEIIRPTGFTGLVYTLQYAAVPGNPTAWTDNDDATGLVPTIVNFGNGFESVAWRDVDTIPELSNGRGLTRIKVEEVDDESLAYTEVQGWLDHDIARQCETYSNPFLRKEIFSGIGDAASPAGSIDLTNSAFGVNLTLVVGSLPHLFIEVTAGPLEGHRFAIANAACDADTLALTAGDPLNTLTPIPDLSGSPFVIRQAWAFGDLFPSTTFQNGGDLNTADNLLTFSAASQTWTTYFLANLGGFGTYWVDSSDVSGPPPINQDGRRIDPAQGLYVHRRGPTALTIPLFGVVRENDFRVPLVQGHNLTGAGYPQDQSYISRGMTLAAGFDGDPDIRAADQVLFWNGDTTPGTISYSSHYLLDAGAPYQRWVSVEDNFVTALDNSPVFKPTRAAFIRRTADLGTWKVAAPWTP